MAGDDSIASGEDRQVGWQADPFGRHQQRWWDGRTWSEKVRSDAKPGIDPVGVEPAPVAFSEPTPAQPIEDALLPLRPPSIADKVAMFVACVVFLALVAVFVVAMTT